MSGDPTPESVLAALDPEQRAAAQAVRGPVCILAGAGTGKTRTITHRAAYAVLSGAVPASSMLAVTFTARAAGELRTRLRALGVGGVQARTFHAAAMRQLGYFWPRVVGGAPPRLVENAFGLVGSAAVPRPAATRHAPSCATCCPSWSGRPARSSGPRTTRRPPPARGARGRTTRRPSPPSTRRTSS